jgi:hypothetical protein
MAESYALPSKPEGVIPSLIARFNSGGSRKPRGLARNVGEP